MYKLGDEVKVYEDPLTEKVLEGKAVLLKKLDFATSISPNEKIGRWIVRFNNGDHNIRSIKDKEVNHDRKVSCLKKS